MAQRSFNIVSQFGGYRNKKDQTNLEADGFLVDGSKNVVSTDGATVASRMGYTLYGAAATEDSPIVGSHVWKTHRGTELPVRLYNTTYEFLDPNTSEWAVLTDSLNSAAGNFAEYWDRSESQDALMMVNGDSAIHYWSGGIATFASATSNTITKEGSETWGEVGFLTAGTRTVIIEGTTYTYTGGEGTTTLTGVTPDPTVAGHTVGATAVQGLRTTNNSSITDLPNTFANDLIAVFDNQVWIGSLTSRDIYASKSNNYEDFSVSSPRIVGEGVRLTLDATPTAFIAEEEVLQISAGRDYWYQTRLELSADNVNESLTVVRLKSSPQQGAVSQGAVGRIKNYTVFISNEPTLDFLGRVENITTSQSLPISDPIKNDFDVLNTANAHVKYFRNNLYIAFPSESKVLVYNLSKQFWEAPWTMPAGRLEIIGGELYMHSNARNETFKLFDGYSDYSSADGEKLPINAVARFSYMNGGNRAQKKVHTELYTEGYMTPATEIEVTTFYEYTGSEATAVRQVSGLETQNIIFSNLTAAPLGNVSLGKEKLAGSGGGAGPNKFRVITTYAPVNYFEMQVEYASNAADQRWEILAFGPDMVMANDDSAEIKQ